jgi:hypothetical protein
MIDTLSELSRKLNQNSDSLDAAITAINEKLAKSGPWHRVMAKRSANRGR